jgi:hypothetical protein
MKVFSARWFLVLVMLAVGGCRDDKPSPATTTPMDGEADLRANLAQLGPEDQRLAEEQKYCPMMEGIRLGETGRPCKVTVKGVSTFVCCESCVQAAEEDPEEALAKIRKLKRERMATSAER